MTLRKINWRKDSFGRVVGTINHNRVIYINQVYKNQFSVVVTLKHLKSYFDFQPLSVDVDTDDLKVAKKEAIKLLTEHINKVNDEIKSLSI